MLNKIEKLSNTFTALLSPMDQDGDLDKNSYQKFIEWQISEGVGLVPCGTTGEAPTLSHEEHEKVVKWCVDLAQASSEKPFVLAGSGSNNTHEAIQLSQHIEKLGADGLLIITPYYNRPTQEGLFAHYQAIANAVSLPIVIYNVPSRTGCNILPETVARLAQNFPNIVGYKAASGDLSQISRLIELTPENFVVLSGDDNQTFEIMKRGGKGVISVASNLIPQRIRKFTENMINGEYDQAYKEHQHLSPLFRDLFLETNPGPVKYAAHLMGLMEETMRLPLVSPRIATKLHVKSTLVDLEILEQKKK